MSSDEEEGQIMDSDPATATAADANTDAGYKGNDSSRPDDIQEYLTKEFNIKTEEDLRHTCFDTLHLKGTDEMKTNDVFDYFSTLPPIFVDWIDEDSCNAGWKDDLSAAKAMYDNSKTIKFKSSDMDMEVEMMDVDDVDANENSILSTDIPVCVPAGRWRYGKPHVKSKNIFIRFANKSDKRMKKSEPIEILSKKYSEDISVSNGGIGIISESMKSKIKSVNIKKTKSKNPWGDLCQTWGINDSQEVFGVDTNIKEERIRRKPDLRHRIGSRPERTEESNDLRRRLGKRKPERVRVIEVSDGESESDDEMEWTTKSKVPRLRMHADDEEVKLKKIDQPYEGGDDESNSNSRHKSANNVGHRLQTNDLRSKINRVDPSPDDSDDDESEEDEYDSKLHSTVSTKKSVWSRLDKISDKKLSSRPEFKESDLRSRITKVNTRERSPLRIEVDNEFYKP